MSDTKSKVVLDETATVQTMVPLVKRAKEEKRTIKFKIGRATAHVEYDPETGKYWFREDNLTSCSPTVIAQAIFKKYLERVDESKIVTE